jgi:DDE_Tnp_1-associated/Transposase DDE domain
MDTQPSPLALLDVLASIPDPRGRNGKRHPLNAILSLAVLAMMTGCKGVNAISQFGRDKGFALAHALGFRRGKTPCASTLSVLFRKLDIGVFEAVLGEWAGSRPASADPPPDPEVVVSLDGKTARGSKDGEVPGQHLVSAFVAETRAVLGQIRVDAKTNEHKAALQLLGILPVAGSIVIGDAMFCQRDVCAKIIEKGGDYIFFVKDNQPSLEVDIGAGLAYEAQARSQAAAFSP